MKNDRAIRIDRAVARIQDLRRAAPDDHRDHNLASEQRELRNLLLNSSAQRAVFVAVFLVSVLGMGLGYQVLLHQNYWFGEGGIISALAHGAMFFGGFLVADQVVKAMRKRRLARYGQYLRSPTHSPK